MRKAERVSAIILIIFGLSVMFYSFKWLHLGELICPDAGFLPFLTGAAISVLGVLWSVQTFLKVRPRHAEQEPCGCSGEKARGRSNVLKLVLAVIAISAYAWFFERAGYLISTLLFITGWQLVVEREKWLRTLIIAALCTAAMYTIFIYLLKVQLPAGEWLS